MKVCLAVRALHSGSMVNQRILCMPRAEARKLTQETQKLSLQLPRMNEGLEWDEKHGQHAQQAQQERRGADWNAGLCPAARLVTCAP